VLAPLQASTITATNTIRVSGGTNTNPGFGWTEDDDSSDTGLYRPAANTIAFSINGAIASKVNVFGHIDGGGSWLLKNGEGIALDAVKGMTWGPDVILDGVDTTDIGLFRASDGWIGVSLSDYAASGSGNLLASNITLRGTLLSSNITVSSNLTVETTLSNFNAVASLVVDATGKVSRYFLPTVGGGSQTPWVSDINAAQYALTNATSITAQVWYLNNQRTSWLSNDLLGRVWLMPTNGLGVVPIQFGVAGNVAIGTNSTVAAFVHDFTVHGSSGFGHEASTVIDTNGSISATGQIAALSFIGSSFRTTGSSPGLLFIGASNSIGGMALQVDYNHPQPITNVFNFSNAAPGMVMTVISSNNWVIEWGVSNAPTGGATSSNYVVASANTLNVSNQLVTWRTNFPTSKMASNVAALAIVTPVANTNTANASGMDFIGGWYSVPGAGLAGTNLIRPGFRIAAIPTVGAANPVQNLVFMSCTNLTNNGSEWIPAGPWTTNGTLSSAGALVTGGTITSGGSVTAGAGQSFIPGSGGGYNNATINAHVGGSKAGIIVFANSSSLYDSAGIMFGFSGGGASNGLIQFVSSSIGTSNGTINLRSANTNTWLGFGSEDIGTHRTNWIAEASSYPGITNLQSYNQIVNIKGTSGNIVFWNRTGLSGATAAGVAIWTNTVTAAGADYVLGVNCGIAIDTGVGVVGTTRAF